VDAAERSRGRDGGQPYRAAASGASFAPRGIPFIHVSTDYVFDGQKGAPYVETDPTNPTGVYGATKRDGEAPFWRAARKAIILRTAWVYGAHGKNFARTMLGAARKMPHAARGGRPARHADRGTGSGGGDPRYRRLEERLPHWRASLGPIVGQLMAMDAPVETALTANMSANTQPSENLFLG
jgi:hypothetical protein